MKDQLVTIPCGCQYMGSGAAPVAPCIEHRYITCGRCGDQAEVTPVGVLCLRCTFGHGSKKT